MRSFSRVSRRAALVLGCAIAVAGCGGADAPVESPSRQLVAATQKVGSQTTMAMRFSMRMTVMGQEINATGSAEQDNARQLAAITMDMDMAGTQMHMEQVVTADT